METYSFLRELADSWALLGMTLVFLAVCVWVFRPGSRKGQDEAATVVFRNDTGPAPVSPPHQKEARPCAPRK